MTNLLLKIFVKDKDDTGNPNVRTAYGALAGIVGIICNTFLFFVKFAIGVMIQSISVMADAFNNLSDAASSIISFVGVKLANRPADKEHPFGHGRYEYIAAFIVSFLVLQVGFSCFKSSITKILHPEALNFNIIMVVILLISIFVKLWLGLFNRKLWKKIHSSVMKATAADAFGDVGITLATVAAIIAEHLTGLKIDGFMGLAVSVMVLIAGINIAKETLEPLIGQAVDEEIYDKITGMVESYDGIVGSHDLIVHNYGPCHTMASIHAEVPKDINFEQAHETIDRIEREVREVLGIFLVIHMDPIEVNDETVLSLKHMVIAIISDLDSNAQIHDFRMVNGENQINLIFDLVVPHSYSEKEEEKLLEDVIETVTKQNERCQCVITLEHSYIANH